MAKIQFLTILLTVTCFLGGVVSSYPSLTRNLIRVDEHSVINQQLKEDNSVQLEQLNDLVKQLKELDRLKGAEESIVAKDVQDKEIEERSTTLADLEARKSALECNCDGTNCTAGSDETIAFHAALTTTSNITMGSAVPFNVVQLNEGSGYNSSTGTFTVPAGGGGTYYFSMIFTIMDRNEGAFQIQLNNKAICTAYEDSTMSVEHLTCGAVASAAEGDKVRFVYFRGTDSTVLSVHSLVHENIFIGFRI